MVPKKYILENALIFNDLWVDIYNSTIKPQEFIDVKELATLKHRNSNVSILSQASINREVYRHISSFEITWEAYK